MHPSVVSDESYRTKGSPIRTCSKTSPKTDGLDCGNHFQLLSILQRPLLLSRIGHTSIVHSYS